MLVFKKQAVLCDCSYVYLSFYSWNLCGQPPCSSWRVCHLLCFSFSLSSLFQEKSSGRTAHYKLTSTVMLWLQTNKTGSGTMNLGGSLTRQVRLHTALVHTAGPACLSLFIYPVASGTKSVLDQRLFSYAACALQ